MFHIKRVFKTNPGQARNVATLAYKAAETFKEAGQRGEFAVYFNAGTTPGEKILWSWNGQMAQLGPFLKEKMSSRQNP